MGEGVEALSSFMKSFLDENRKGSVTRAFGRRETGCSPWCVRLCRDPPGGSAVQDLCIGQFSASRAGLADGFGGTRFSHKIGFNRVRWSRLLRSPGDGGNSEESGAV